MSISSPSGAALEKLAALHPRQARVVELRYFGGLLEGTAIVIGVAGVDDRGGLGGRQGVARSRTGELRPHSVARDSGTAGSSGTGAAPPPALASPAAPASTSF